MLRNLTSFELAVLEGSGQMLPDDPYEREEEINRLARQALRDYDRAFSSILDVDDDY
jgi:hypothetical protein